MKKKKYKNLKRDKFVELGDRGLRLTNIYQKLEIKGMATTHNQHCTCNNVYHLAAVSYFAITL